MEDPLSISLHIVLLTTGPQIGILGLAIGGIVLVLLLLLSAIISGSEVALFSLSEADKLEIEGIDTKKSVRVQRLLEDSSKSLVTILVLNTVVNVSVITLAAFLTLQLADIYNWSETVVVVLEMVVLTFVLLIVSEISPKIAASRNAKSYSLAVSGLLVFGQRLFGPISGPTAKLLAKFDENEASEKVKISSDDVKTMADLSEASGTLEEAERDLIHSVIDLGEKTVVEVMTSRVDVTGIPTDSDMKSAINIISESGHSRLPLFTENLDHVAGIIYAKDLLPYIGGNGRGKRPSLEDIARPPLFVPESKRLDDLLNDFQEKRTHLAVVVDEYGGTEGLVTMEDVLEEIVGDIRIESPEDDESEYERISRGRYRFDAGIDLDDVAELVNDDLEADENISFDTENFDFETLGGLIFHLVEDIPNEGQELQFGPLKLRVESIEKQRILSVIVTVDESLTD